MNIKAKFLSVFLVAFIAAITLAKISCCSEERSFSVQDLGQRCYIDRITISKDFITIQMDMERGLKQGGLIFRNIHLSVNTSSHLEEYRQRENEFKQTGKAQLKAGEGLAMSEHNFGFTMVVEKIKDGVAWVKYEESVSDYQVRPPINSHDTYRVRIDKEYKSGTQPTDLR